MLQRDCIITPRALVPSQVELEGEETGRFASIPSVTVALEDYSPYVVWRVTVYAELVKGAQVYLGQVLTFPPRTREHRSRIICEASCPGAKRWTIKIEPSIVSTPADLDARTKLTVAACPDLLVPGVAVMPQSAAIVGERVGFEAGQLTVASETVIIDPTPTDRVSRIVKLSVFQVGSGGTVRLTSAAWFPQVGGVATPVLLPPNGANTWDFGAGILPPLVLFTATFPIATSPGGWFVEYRW